MKCLVAIKRVIDFNVKVRLKADGSAVETDHVKMSMNPFDEIALEEAVRLKEAGKLNEIIAVSIGPMANQETLRAALARGADRAILINTDFNTNSHPSHPTGTPSKDSPPEANIYDRPINIAKILKTLVLQQDIQLVFLGKQAIDDDCNQTGQMLAGLLNWSQGCNVSKIEQLKIEPLPSFIEITRETDAGLESLRLTVPAVLTADLRLNEPRYIALPNLMKAKNKPLEIIDAQEFIKQNHLDLKPHGQVIKVTAPVIQRAGKKLNSVKELVEELKLK